MAEKKTKKTTTKKQNTKEVKEIKFSKSQIIKSQKYAENRDALNAILKDSKKYSFEEVDSILIGFYKGGKK